MFGFPAKDLNENLSFSHDDLPNPIRWDLGLNGDRLFIKCAALENLDAFKRFRDIDDVTGVFEILPKFAN